jgi:hypothetical protein
MPSAHVAVVLGRGAQAMPQAPQWAVLERVSVSQPLLASPSQSALGAVHMPTPHRPLVHAGAPPATEQRVPQAPQWAMEVCVSTQAPSQHERPTGHARIALQPGTQVLPTQRLPRGQCSLVTHSTQARVVGLQ